MKPPANYSGPSEMRVPHGYIDVTTLSDLETRGIPGRDHPFYRMRDLIASVLEQEGCADSMRLADKIMEALP